MASYNIVDFVSAPDINGVGILPIAKAPSANSSKQNDESRKRKSSKRKPKRSGKRYR